VSCTSSKNTFTYSCRQLNATVLLSHDQDFPGTNQFQIQIQPIKMHQKTHLRSSSHNILGWPNLLSKISQHFAPFLRTSSSKNSSCPNLINVQLMEPCLITPFGSFWVVQLVCMTSTWSWVWSSTITQDYMQKFWSCPMLKIMECKSTLQHLLCSKIC
jgi:hypothetical protein